MARRFGGLRARQLGAPAELVRERVGLAERERRDQLAEHQPRVAVATDAVLRTLRAALDRTAPATRNEEGNMALWSGMNPIATLD